MNNRMIIIDGNSLINRAFYAIRGLTNKKGFSTNAIYGFLNMVETLKTDYEPKYMLVTFDLKQPTFRHKMFDDYKAQRSGMPDELREQMPVIKEFLDNLGIARVEMPGYEADDLIGTIAKETAQEGTEVIVVTGDKDALQLVDDNLRVMITKSGVKKLKEYTDEVILEEYGVKKEQLIDHKALMGDNSDNIPGIAGIGPKTATKLLKQFETIDRMVNNIEEISSKRIRTKIENNIANLELYKKLGKIVTNVPLEYSLSELMIGEKNEEKLLEMYKEYELNSFIKSLKQTIKKVSNESIEVVLINEETSETAFQELKASSKLSFHIIQDENNFLDDNILGIAFYNEKSLYYINTFDHYKSKIKDLFEDESIIKVGHGLKEDIIKLSVQGIKIKNIKTDTFLAWHLIAPSRKDYLISDLCFEFLNQKIKSEEALLGKGRKKKTYESIELEDLISYAKDICIAIMSVADPLKKELKSNDLLSLYEDVEMPLIEILASMQVEGISINQETLAGLDNEITEKLEFLVKEIYDLAGEEFNINSPKQLGVILFEKLGLPVIKKTKTGYSTAHSVLEKLKSKHPIIQLVMEYRTYSKLKSTYVDGMYDVINPVSNKIHSHFNQTVTVTGRLSSTNPNLQNIPIRMDFGRNLRKIFTASEGRLLIGADYSQIELRVLAHMSGDENLIKAYKNNEDIHTLTASQVFDIPFDEVSSEDRRRAKAINFGIVYGMGAFSLSQDIKVTKKEAEQYIDQYFAKYPSVKEFMESNIEECKKNGYVQTISERKRYIPEINSKNFHKRGYGERIARNTPIQGSAADIIKVAMIDVYNALKDKGLKSKLILQVHDELIIDTYQDEIEEVKTLLKENMEKAYELKVPLKVDMNTGANWYETK